MKRKETQGLATKHDKLKQVMDWLLAIVGSMALLTLIAVVTLEWLAGCGESWVQADGTRVMGECVFIGKLVNIDK
jgi:hypothetical protein